MKRKQKRGKNRKMKKKSYCKRFLEKRRVKENKTIRLLFLRLLFMKNRVEFFPRERFLYISRVHFFLWFIDVTHFVQGIDADKGNQQTIESLVALRYNKKKTRSRVKQTCFLFCLAPRNLSLKLERESRGFCWNFSRGFNFNFNFDEKSHWCNSLKIESLG